MNFRVFEDAGEWEGTIGGKFIIPDENYDEFAKKLQNKTIVVLPPKLN